MTRVAAAGPAAAVRALAEQAARWGVELVAADESGDALAPRLAELRPDAVLALARAPHLSGRLVSACDGHGIRLVSVAESTRDRRAASLLGVVDPVDGPMDWGALGRADSALALDEPLPDVSEAVPAAGPPPETAPRRRFRPFGAPRDAEPADRGGRVIAVWGPDGAPGRSSVAVALAGEFAATGRAVALADADSRAAAIAPALALLDEAPGFGAACRLAGAGALTSAELDRVAAPHPDGVRVLTGIARAGRWPELSASRVAGVLAAVRAWAEVTVVDVAASLEVEGDPDAGASTRAAATLEVLARADRVVAVAAADPVGLGRFLRVFPDLLDHVPRERVAVVANKVRASVVGLGPEAQVRATLARLGGIEVAESIPWDPAGFDAALVAGRPLGAAAPRSPARAAIQRLTASLASDPLPPRG